MTQITDAMVEKALVTLHGDYPGYPFNAMARRDMRAALEAALAEAQVEACVSAQVALGDEQP